MNFAFNLLLFDDAKIHDNQYIMLIIMLNNIKYQNNFCNMLKDRLLEFIKDERLNPNQFYIKTGLGIGFLDKVGEKLKRPSVEKISKTFPHWNIDYLQTGDGEKYRKDMQNNNMSDSKIQNSNVQQGNYINCPELVSLLANTTKGYQEMIKKRDAQIDRLIEIIEKSR
jgi:hypothetical protein